jgi:hypothetical protein
MFSDQDTSERAPRVLDCMSYRSGTDGFDHGHRASIGMSEYAQRFAENGINFTALPHMTDQDLKDIGVPARTSADNARSRRPSRS